MPHSAAGDNEGGVIGITDVDRQTGLYEDCLTGVDCERFIEEGSKIEACGARRGIARKVLADAFVKDLECNFHFFVVLYWLLDLSASSSRLSRSSF